jgi:SAM-dependent methyltransferase
MLLSLFEKSFPLSNVEKNLHIAVIGGSRDEPELELLKLRGFNLTIKLYGIENYEHHLDLNLPTMNHKFEKFDLILCSQVLEHIWNHQNSFKIFENLLKPGAHLWISCPASNRHHGSPEYYVSGFHADFFVKNFANTRLRVLQAGVLGTRRNYVATHLLPDWLSVRGHRFPLFFAFENRTKIQAIFLSIRYIPRNILISFQSPKLTADPTSATETWVLAQLADTTKLD